MFAAVGHHNDPVGRPRSQTLKGALEGAGLALTSLLQRLIVSVQEELVTLKVSRRWCPVKGQTVGAVGFNGQTSDSSWACSRNVKYKLAKCYFASDFLFNLSVGCLTCASLSADARTVNTSTAGLDQDPVLSARCEVTELVPCAARRL